MRHKKKALWGMVIGLWCGLAWGASCGSGDSATQPKRSEGATGGENSQGKSASQQVDQVDGLDLSNLATAERRVFWAIANDMLSPCGEPVSVARCAREGRPCRACMPALRYIARLISEGMERSEIEELYELRYGRNREVQLEIEGRPIRGSPMAPVTLAIFSDFECPFCGRAHPIIREILREFEGKVRVIFFNYPLSSHIHAMPAARAAIAAGNQGKFWEMHDLLFDHQDALSEEDLSRYARQLGLDMERFRADMRSEETQKRIEADRNLGRAIGVDHTPTIFINGRRFEESLTSLASYLRETLESL
ncbi:MAG: DsbA family protein [Deltaproteobacteria bacterium]|nr:DsbA family protein [Deltaproteobacteria bacterium]